MDKTDFRDCAILIAVCLLVSVILTGVYMLNFVHDCHQNGGTIQNTPAVSTCHY